MSAPQPLPLRLEFEDLVTAARTVWGEARGEPIEGKVAVACVLLNRARDPKPNWWGDTVTEVCRKAWQFSCWNADDPNRAPMLAAYANDPVMLECILAVLHAVHLVGTENDPVLGACHYHVHNMPHPPKWSRGRTPDVVIHRHAFYVGVD